MINNVVNTAQTNVYPRTQSKSNSPQEGIKSDTTTSSYDSVVVESTPVAEDKGYKRSAYMTKAEAASFAKNQKSVLLESLVKKLLQGQAGVNGRAGGSLSDSQITKLKDLIGEGISVDSMSVDSAKAAISDGGYWGVEAVSDRLVDFAVKVSGGDKSKFETMKNAIMDGYREAEKVWGGALPQICKDTIDMTMKKLEQRFNSFE